MSEFETDVFRRIAYDDRLVTPGREIARGAYDVVTGVRPESFRREFGRDVLVKVAREYFLGDIADRAEATDVPGTIGNPS